MNNDLKIRQNQFGQPIGFPIKNHVSAQLFSENIHGQHVRLIPIIGEMSHQAASQIWNTVSTEPNAACWTYLPYQAPQSQMLLQHALENLFGFKESVHFLIEIDADIQGWVALLNPRAEHAVVEIGNVYFSHKMKQSTAATEAVFLLLQQCFTHGFRRVEWKCDDCNQPSKTAALRLGFQYEGLFRQDRIIKERNRNTAWFSIIDEEWPELEQAYQQWLSPENFDAQGRQKQRLADFIST